MHAAQEIAIAIQLIECGIAPQKSVLYASASIRFERKALEAQWDMRSMRWSFDIDGGRDGAMWLWGALRCLAEAQTARGTLRLVHLRQAEAHLREWWGRYG